LSHFPWLDLVLAPRLNGVASKLAIPDAGCIAPQSIASPMGVCTHAEAWNPSSPKRSGRLMENIDVDDENFRC
jgi:hypothetical protein